MKGETLKTETISMRVSKPERRALEQIARMQRTNYSETVRDLIRLEAHRRNIPVK